MGNRRSAVTESDEIDYALPAATLLQRGKGDPGPDVRDREAVAKSLLDALRHFGVEAKLLGVVSGPHVSRYELQLAPGTKVSKVARLRDDLAYALASTDIRILAPIPGKKAVGVEVPNQRRRLVRLGDIYDGRPKGSSPLAVWLGKDVSGQAVWADLAPMPHALVAGTTGSGKSGCINAMLCSVLLHASPNEVRLVLVDPKRVELNHYERLPHLLTPVVTNPRMAANVLANLIGEMESRYGVMSDARARNLPELNQARRKAGEAPLPYILCVIDELADLMMIAPAEVEDSIIRLAQKSRAVGIHLVLATQRPSTDVITGTIKVNIPARIAFSVASQVDSRVILDQGGAETLLGQGDMLLRGAGTSRLQRLQGAFVAEAEIARLVAHWGRQGEPEFDEALLEVREGTGDQRDDEMSPDHDDLLDDAARIVVQSQTASVSMIQRRLRVGYTRAGRLIDMLERRGIISGYEGSKPRQVLVSEGELRRVLDQASGDGAAPAGREHRGRSTEPIASPTPAPSWNPLRQAGGRLVSGQTAWRCAGGENRRCHGHQGRSGRVADRRGPETDPHPPQDRHSHGRAADQDPHQVPAGARERGVGGTTGARLRQGLPSNLRAVPWPRRGRPDRRVQAHGRGGAGRRPRLWVQRARAGAAAAARRGAAARLAGDGRRWSLPARPSWSCCWSSG